MAAPLRRRGVESAGYGLHSPFWFCGGPRALSHTNSLLVIPILVVLDDIVKSQIIVILHQKGLIKGVNLNINDIVMYPISY